MSGEPADPDEVLHHITVADVENLHGMVLTEEQAEQVKEVLGSALTAAINKLRNESPMRVCATCDVEVPDVEGDPHPHEWCCSNPACGLWWHVTDGDTCPQCGSAPLV